MVEGRRPLRLRHSYSARCRVVWLMLSGLSPQAASTACGVSRSTAYRLLRRFEQGGWAALHDRPSVAKRCPHRLSAQAEAPILELRRQTTRPGQTARPKHSSASSNANGHTASSTHQASIEHEHSQAGYAGTTTTDHTAAWTATHPKAASHTLRGPTARPARLSRP